MGKYVKTDMQGYINAVRKAVFDELNYIEPTLVDILKNELGALTLRRVDAKYQSEMLNSISTFARDRANSILLSIGAGGEKDRQNQAFRAVYYEYGTGNLAEPPAGWSESISGGNGWGSWNMARKGLDIYQRPRGTWIDLGGNEHTSRIKGAPKKLPNTEGSFGEEIHPTFWFREGMKKCIPLIDDAVRRAVKKVPISAYIGIRSMRKVM